MVTSLALVPVVVPAAGALIHLLAGWRPATRWVGTVSAAMVLLAAVLLGRAALTGTTTAVGGLLLVDPLSAFMLVVIGAVGLVTALGTPAFLDAEPISDRARARHSVLVQAFLAAMALAVLAANIGVLWVAVEATTIVTAFLVGQRRTKAAVEAAWKYVVICSAGIAIALLGIVLLNFAGGGLDWLDLTARAAQLDPGVTRLAVALLVIGFGTKAGLAPLHAWLPDAHGQAPAPVSGLMSGVLLAVAFSAILRVTVIADGALGPGFARALLLVTGLASLAVAASLLLAQRDYKRMLAYSSIEHMGLIAVGAAVGGRAALAAVLLHVLGHGLVKSTLFLGAGQVLQIYGTSRIDGVRGLAARQPLLAGCLGAGVLALIGLPPFSLFASELGIVRAGLGSGSAAMIVGTVLALLLTLVIAAALVGHASRMLLGGASPVAVAAPSARSGAGSLLPADIQPDPVATTLPAGTAIALFVGLGGAALLGVTTGSLTGLLAAAAAVLSGAP